MQALKNIFVTPNKYTSMARVLIFAVFAFVVIVTIYSWLLTQKRIQDTRTNHQVEIPIETEFVANVDKREVYQMPEFELALPPVEWFSGVKMQAIGYALGLTYQAEVRGGTNQASWTEGAKQLYIDGNVGTIDFSTAFNIDQILLPEGVPTKEEGLVKIKEFLEGQSISTAYYDFDNVAYQYLIVDEDRQLIPEDGPNGSLLRIDLPYATVSVPVIIPVKSYVVIDADSNIRMLSLFLPNIQPTGQDVTLISWNQAKKDLESSKAEVVVREQEGVITIDASYPAYYLNLADFYTTSKKRIFRPVYVFDGAQGQVVVSAQKL